MSEIDVLIIAAHPDDELLGCGGTVAKLADEGRRITALIACEGESVRYGKAGAGHDDAMQKAADILGIAELRHLGLPDQRLETLAQTDIITPIEKAVADCQPAVVFVQHGGDVNMDHQMLFKAAMVATRPIEECIEVILAYDTVSSTEWAYPRTFVPDTWVDISATLQRKLDAMACYVSEVRDFPHPRSLETLTHKARACGSECCMEAAESFMTIRRVSRSGKKAV